MVAIVSALKGQNCGDIIIAVKPIIHSISNQFKAIHCDYCLKLSIKRLKSCSKCRQLFYCDKNCQRMDWIYHKNECKVLANKMFKPNETQASERLLIRLWLTIKSDQTFASKRYQMIDGTDISLNDIKINTEELSKNIDRIIEFQLICNHFKDYGLVFDEKELYHWFAVITCSSVKVNTKLYPSEEDYYLDMPKELGPGIYIELYSVSHSCDPNTAIVLNGLSLQLRAMKPISVGTVITRCYVHLAQNNSKRHKQLKDKYLIDCNPSVCAINDSKAQKLDQLFDLMQEERRQQNPPFDSMSDHIFQTAIDIFGEYHPAVSHFFMMLGAKIALEHKSYGPVLKLSFDFYHKLDHHFLITYGADHPMYSINFKKKCTY